ncbi:MAG TPA: biopolymer transporter ExbD [Allosphingosinicella sp.]|nr:biopolymer transporter ExbD [Allosphingosinicella sp.]
MAMIDPLPAGMSIRRPPASGSRRFALGPAGTEPGTISDINTTPLIDVMLVLLIMFIITIPVASHKVPLDLPGRPPVLPLPERPFHQLDIAADGSLAWNGAALAADQLQGQLLQLAASPSLPELRLNAASEARYERIDQILAQIRLAGVDRLGFVGNERYRRAF